MFCTEYGAMHMWEFTLRVTKKLGRNGLFRKRNQGALGQLDD